MSDLPSRAASNLKAAAKHVRQAKAILPPMLSEELERLAAQIEQVHRQVLAAIKEVRD